MVYDHLPQTKDVRYDYFILFGDTPHLSSIFRKTQIFPKSWGYPQIIKSSLDIIRVYILTYFRINKSTNMVIYGDLLQIIYGEYTIYRPFSFRTPW